MICVSQERTHFLLSAHMIILRNIGTNFCYLGSEIVEVMEVRLCSQERVFFVLRLPMEDILWNCHDLALTLTHHRLILLSSLESPKMEHQHPDIETM